ncbi:AI-2E family transporter [Capnocytophaga catalasegens]|uniref:AI-2E family transporter n=1 Tax=Capnocytophaga catalasegens TaxID=1004260 RepID=A0AAV5AXT9_9FLAO|nr:AI-2E family transporter [Capnocytophaga catalasegens]GIZ15582.1 AI-2E family transporter [Capnocytophaga catalasegens]GJM50181.1 AI-2E family transporter [Capnocytophaga catalasegens]GJM52056.1 AI-2E family transporter [Capnocytophaga catalasegens]
MNAKIISNGILRAVGILFVIVLVAYAIYELKTILVYVVIAMVISLMGRPLVRLLKQRLRFSNTIAVLSVMGLILLLLGGIISMFIPLLLSQGRNLSSINFETLTSGIVKNINQGVRLIGIKNFSVDITMFSQLFDVNDISSIVNGLMTLLSDIGIGFFSVVFIVFFFLKDGTAISNAFIGLINRKYIGKTRQSIEAIKNLLSRYFVGLLLQITVVFVILTIVLLILGVQDAVMIAFLCALLNLIPYLGPLIGGVLISVLTMSSFIEEDFASVVLPKMIYVLIGFLIAQLVDNFFSQPIIFSNSVKSHPLEVFLIILISGTLFGVVGMVVAVPAYTVIKVILKAIFADNKFVKLLTKNI